MGYREQSQRGSGTSESVDNLISSPDSPSNPDLVAPNTLSTHTLENQSAEAISIALPKAPDLSDQRIQDPNDPNIFYEPLIVVSLEQIQDKEFIERHKEIRRSYCLKGLDDKSTIDDIASRLSDFAASAQPDFCRIVYDWGVEKHGRESIPLWDYQFDTHVALVVGNEGSGIRQKTLEHCDTVVQIPMMHDVESLNASVTAGIVSYEVLRQRKNS